MSEHDLDKALDKTDHPDKCVKILVARDARSRCYGVIAVPQKGLDPDEYVTRRGLKFLDFLGYQSVLLKSDQEPALGKALRSIRAHRGSDTQNMLEKSPAYVSKSNGFIERAIQVVEGKFALSKQPLKPG